MINFFIVLAFLAPITLAHDEQPVDVISRRSKRSNIPCGSSFTPCDGRRTAQLLQGSRDQSVAAVLKRDPGGQFVVAPQTRRQMLQAALVEAREEADRLFNITEPALSNQDDPSEPFRYWSSFMKTVAPAKDLSYPAVLAQLASTKLKRLGE